MGYLIYLVPVLNALFGWAIVSAIVTVVFRPAEKKNFIFFRFQGLIPSLRQSLAEDMAEYVSKELVSFKELEDKLLSPDNLASIHDYLDKKAEDFLRVKLAEKFPVISMFITDSLIKTAKESLVTELDKMIPEIIKMYSGKIQQDFDVKKKVKGFILLYPVQELEAKFYAKAGNKILRLKICIAFLGFLLGVIEIGIFALILNDIFNF